MCKSTGITLLLCWFFSQPATLCAQSPLRNLNYPHNLLSTRYTLLEKALPELKNFYLKPIALPGYKARQGREIFITPFAKPLFLSTQNSGLFYKYWSWSRSSSTNPKHSVTTGLNNAVVNREVFSALYNKSKVGKKKEIRASWKKTLGVDVWYPYYKTKEIEDWIKERFSIKVFGLKGKPRFEKNKIVYVFKSKF